MDFNKETMLKLVIIALVTIAALAVMNIVIQLIQAVLPFLIIGAGIYAAYRWALRDAPAPTVDEVEEQTRGIFRRFRRGKKAVETTMQVADMLSDLGEKPAKPEREPVEEVEEKAEPAKPVEPAKSEEKPSKPHRRRPFRARRAKAEAAPAASAAAPDTASREEKARQVKQSLEHNPKGDIEFKDHDVLISAADVVQPDISRLQERESDKGEVNDDVMAQIAERRRRLEERGN